jgi:hypothetical protein
MSNKFLIGTHRFILCNSLTNFDCNIRDVIQKQLDEKTDLLASSYWEVVRSGKLLKAGSIHDVFDYIKRKPWVGVTDLTLYRNQQIVAKSSIL